MARIAIVTHMFSRFQNYRRRIVLGAAVIVLNGFFWYWRIGDSDRLPALPQQSSARTARELGSPEHRERIDVFVNTLLRESLQESVVKLCEYDEHYFYPGFTTGRKLHQVNLEEMLSNRRCVKVMSDINAIEEERRDVECRAAFKKCFSAHKDAMHAAFRHARDPRAPPNTRSLKATQLALCAIMYATAKYASTQTLVAQCDAVYTFAQECEQSAKGSIADESPSVATFMRRFSAPDNRALLNFATLHMSRRADVGTAESFRQVVSDYPKAEVPVVAWQARICWFDVPHRMEGVPLDESHGLDVYTFVDWPRTLYFDVNAQENVVRGAVDAMRSR